MKNTITFACLAAAFSANEAEIQTDQFMNYYDEGPDCGPDYEKIRENEFLDTPEYQALPAKCKQDIIWERCQRNLTPERFFIGHEF